VDIRGHRETSKAQLVISFLKGNSDKAFYSTDVVRNLQSVGVCPGDIMGTVRRHEAAIYIKGL
jgi:hypothetical protein